jgi:hypothetical protein
VVLVVVIEMILRKLNDEEIETVVNWYIPRSMPPRGERAFSFIAGITALVMGQKDKVDGESLSKLADRYSEIMSEKEFER